MGLVELELELSDVARIVRTGNVVLLRIDGLHFCLRFQCAWRREVNRYSRNLNLQIRSPAALAPSLK